MICQSSFAQCLWHNESIRFTYAQLHSPSVCVHLPNAYASVCTCAGLHVGIYCYCSCGVTIILINGRTPNLRRRSHRTSSSINYWKIKALIAEVTDGCHCYFSFLWKCSLKNGIILVLDFSLTCLLFIFVKKWIDWKWDHKIDVLIYYSELMFMPQHTK